MNHSLFVFAASFFLLIGCYTPSHTEAPVTALAMLRETTPDRATSNESIPTTLNVEQAIALAKRNNSHLSATNANVEMLEARAIEAGQIKNPEIRVQNIRLDQFLNDEPRTSVSIRVNPARPGELDAKVAKANAETAIARAEGASEQQLVENEVRWLFYDVLLLDAELVVANDALDAHRKLAAVVKTRLEHALATRIDEAFAELKTKEAEQDQLEAKVQRDLAYAELMASLGLPKTSHVRLLGDVHDPALLPAIQNEEQLLLDAVKRRSEVLSAAAQVDAADAMAYLERAKRWPWLSFFEVGYEFAPQVREGLGWTFEAGVEVPLFSLNQGGVAAADAARVHAQKQLRAEVDRIAREVRQRVREVEAARQLLQAFVDNAVSAAEQASTEVQSALDAGQVDMLGAALVEERRIAINQQKLKLLRRYHRAMTRLRAAVGGEVK